MQWVWGNEYFRFLGYDAKRRGKSQSASESRLRAIYTTSGPRGAYLPEIVLGPDPRGILLDPLVGTEGMTLHEQNQSGLAPALHSKNRSNLKVSLLETKCQPPLWSR